MFFIEIGNYCNKAVKTDGFDVKTKRAFYRRKKALIYHLVRGHDEFGILIGDCRIDRQENPFVEGYLEMYTFSLCHDGFVLRVHQRKTARLEGLFNWIGAMFIERGVYMRDENDAKYDKTEWDENIDVNDGLLITKKIDNILLYQKTELSMKVNPDYNEIQALFAIFLIKKGLTDKYAEAIGDYSIDDILTDVDEQYPILPIKWISKTVDYTKEGFGCWNEINKDWMEEIILYYKPEYESTLNDIRNSLDS